MVDKMSDASHCDPLRYAKANFWDNFTLVRIVKIRSKIDDIIIFINLLCCNLVLCCLIWSQIVIYQDRREDIIEKLDFILSFMSLSVNHDLIDPYHDNRISLLILTIQSDLYR